MVRMGGRMPDMGSGMLDMLRRMADMGRRMELMGGRMPDMGSRMDNMAGRMDNMSNWRGGTGGRRGGNGKNGARDGNPEGSGFRCAQQGRVRLLRKEADFASVHAERAEWRRRGRGDPSPDPFDRLRTGPSPRERGNLLASSQPRQVSSQWRKPAFGRQGASVNIGRECWDGGQS